MSRVRSAPVAIGLATGWMADALLGDPSRYHPVAGFGQLAALLERALWRPARIAGAVYALCLVVPVAAAAAAADGALRHRRGARFLLTAVTTWIAVGGRSLGGEARRLAAAVEAGDLDRARRIAPALVGRDPTGLDEAELCRAAVESVAENTADAVVGSLLWGAVAGPGGIAAHRAANTLDAMVGHRDRRYERFGWAAARLDDALTWPAARMAALLTVALAPAAGGSALQAWRVLRRDGKRHPSPNAGRLQAAFAGALGVRLGGRNRYGDLLEDRPVLGDGRPPDVEAVHQAICLSALVGAVSSALCAVLAWGIQR